jgi:hypothetical protein
MGEMTNGDTLPDDTVAADPISPIVEDTQVNAPVEPRADQVTVPMPPGVPAPVAASPRVRYTSGAAPVPIPATPARRGWWSPTMTDLSEPTGIDPDHGSRSVATGGSRRWRWWIAAGVVPVIIVGGAVAFTRLRSHPPSPSQSVREYFDDLAAGDTTSAMALVEDPGSYASSDDPLLSPTALSRAADRPAHVTVIGTASTTIDGGRNATAVSVTYAVGATTVHQTMTVVGRDSEASTTTSVHPYLLKAPFITVALSATAGRAVSVNGISIPAKTTHTLAYPAAYVATAPGNQLLATATAPAVYNSASGAVEADISLPAPTMAPGAGALVQSAVNHALDRCAASTSAAPANCPFHYADSSATMKWTVATYPRIRVAVNGVSVTFDDAGHPGSLHYAATTAYFFGLIPHTDNGTTNTDVTGTAALADGAVTVSFTHK